MSETYTPQPDSKNNESNINETFESNLEMQPSDADRIEAARRAQTIIQGSTQPQEVAQSQPEPSGEKSGWSTRAKVATGFVVGATLATGGTAAALDTILPGQEIASASSTIEQGGDITSAVDRSIDKIEAQKVDPADPTKRADVIHQAVDIQNGVVHPGQTVEVIAEKSPIFGNVTYRAAPTEAAVDTPQPTEQTTIPAPNTH